MGIQVFPLATRKHDKRTQKWMGYGCRAIQGDGQCVNTFGWYARARVYVQVGGWWQVGALQNLFVWSVDWRLGCLPVGIVEYRHWSATSPLRCRQFHRQVRATAAVRQHSVSCRCVGDNNIRNSNTRTLPVASFVVLCVHSATLWLEPEVAAPGKGNSDARFSRFLWNAGRSVLLTEWI